MSLSGKRVVILGGTSGIGLAVARMALAEKAAVVVASSRQQSVDRALAALGSDAAGEAVDLANEAAIELLIKRLGAFDHLVYTAGEPLRLERLDTMALDDARAFFQIRYWGALAAVKHGARQIRPGGSIVLTNGVAGLRPGPGWTVAASICGAMESLNRALALELAPLRVNILCPGVVDTALWDGLPPADRQALYDSQAQRLPVGRIGTAQDVAQAYLYLMKQGYSTGQSVVVDGGSVLA